MQLDYSNLWLLRNNHPYHFCPRPELDGNLQHTLYYTGLQFGIIRISMPANHFWLMHSCNGRTVKMSQKLKVFGVAKTNRATRNRAAAQVSRDINP